MPRSTSYPRPASVSELARSLAPEIAGLPRLSCTVERFLADASRDTARAEDFAAALDLDPVLRGWVLRQANSSFAKLSRPVTSVAQACVVIGVAPLSRLVYAACTRDLLRRPLVCYRYPGQGFWLHGLAVCAATGILAEHARPDLRLVPEEARVAGLIHDVGKLLLDARLPRAGGPRHVSRDEERSLLGADHGLVSAAVAMHWRLPAAVVEAVAGHHDREPSLLGRCVAVADRLVRHWGLGVWTYARLEQEPPWRELLDTAAPLGVTRPALENWCATLPPILAGLEEMVRAIGHGEPPALPPAQTAEAPPVREHRARRSRRSSRRRESPRRRGRR